MANDGDYKELKNRWSESLHKVGDPKLDALIDIVLYSPKTNANIANGDYFASGFPAVNRGVGEVVYNLIATGDKYLIMEDIRIFADYFNVESGSFKIDLFLYAENSDSNTFTYTPTASASVGVPLNLDFVNKVSNTKFSRPEVVGITGEPDFTLLSFEYFRDTNGNRESITGTESSFFEDGRRLILSPNTEYMFVTIYDGTATPSSTATVRNQFYFTEVEEI
ncbi:hypothetical protein N9895_02065 [Gammaproteobacteria bacterium]|nr:hypothetical protein [Gammaproteobacteria bacterium]